MFELLLDYLQIRFGNLDTCGQDVLDTDNDIRPVGICGNLAFNTGEIALDNTHPVAYNKGAIVEADTVGTQVHDEHEVLHLLLGDDQKGTGGKVAHIEKGDPVDIGYVAGCLFGGTDKYQVPDDRDLTSLPAVLQLGDHSPCGKIEFNIHTFFRFQAFQNPADSEFLLVTCTGGKPISLTFNHLRKCFGNEDLRNGYASRFERDSFIFQTGMLLHIPYLSENE